MLKKTVKGRPTMYYTFCLIINASRSCSRSGQVQSSCWHAAKIQRYHWSCWIDL